MGQGLEGGGKSALSYKQGYAHYMLRCRLVDGGIDNLTALHLG
jgi:hypothetical protein